MRQTGTFLRAPNNAAKIMNAKPLVPYARPTAVPPLEPLEAGARATA